MMKRLRIFSDFTYEKVEKDVDKWRTENLDKAIGVEMTFKTAATNYNNHTTVFIEYNWKTDVGDNL